MLIALENHPKTADVPDNCAKNRESMGMFMLLIMKTAADIASAATLLIQVCFY